MEWKRLLSRHRLARSADPPDRRQSDGLVAVPEQCAFFHITHWKAASQWMRAILVDLFGAAVVQPKYYERQLLNKRILAGKVYACAYLGKPEYDALAMPGEHRHGVLIRDLRDTLVSAYFSVRYSHESKVDDMDKGRSVLNLVSKEDGLLYLIETWLCGCSWIQRTWLENGTPFLRLEDCMRDAPGTLNTLFQDGWGLTIDPALLKTVIERHSFARLSGGREPGQEDSRSHYRRGIAGDWREHFTPKVARRFAEAYNDLVLRAGYETDPSWHKTFTPAPASQS